jgi:multiple sugar transport system permease protein
MASPCIAILIFLMIFPLVYALTLSFHKWHIGAGTSWSFVGGYNYAKLIFSEPEFYKSLFNTLVIGGVSLILEFMIGLILALALNREIKGRRVLVAVLSLPMMLIPVMVGHIWRIMYFRDVGPIDYLTKKILGFSINWLEDAWAAKLSCIIANVWEWSPFIMLILLAGFTAVPVSLYEAAQIDGASSWQIFTKITLPTVKPLLILAILIRTMEEIKIFDIIYLLTTGGPGVETQTITIYIFKLGFQYFDMGYAAAASFILLIIVTIIVNIFVKYLPKR